MSGLCGWTGFSFSRDESLACIERMCRSLARTSGEAVAQAVGQRSALAVTDPGRQMECFQQGDAMAAIYGRPRSSDPRAPSLGNGLARYLIERYREVGPAVLGTLRGPFALAAMLGDGDDAILAIDRMAICPLTYAVLPQGLVFASSADALNLHPGVTVAIDAQSVFNYIFFHTVPGGSGIFRGQQRLPPGGYLRLRGGKLETGAYWKMSYREDAGTDLTSLKTEFRALLRQSVRDVVDGTRIGTFLSGGTDSSTVAGVLAEISAHPVRTYSIGFDVPGYDEMAYARIAARHFGTDHHEYFVTPADVLNFVPKLAAGCDQPFGNASAVPTYYCAHMARQDNVETLLGGDGGDELFGGNERYATQKIFSWYDAIPEAIRRGLIQPLLSIMPGTDRVTLLRKLDSYVSQARIPMPDRLHSYNLLNRNPLESVFVDDFLEAVDPRTPLSLFREAYENADADGMLNRMLALDLQFTLANNDLYKVNTMCEMAGVKVAYPLLSEDLVNFSARLPSHLKVKGLKLRYFFKQALDDFLPKEIIRKKKHGFGLPIGIWMQKHGPLRDLAYDTLQALKARKILRPEFIDQLVEHHRSGFAAHYGGEIWSLMILELWFQAHRNTMDAEGR